MEQLEQKLKIHVGFLYGEKSLDDWKMIVQVTRHVLGYGDIPHSHAARSTFKRPHAVYHCALHFITGDPYRTHHCVQYGRAGWFSLTTIRDLHSLNFTYKGFLQKRPQCFTSII